MGGVFAQNNGLTPPEDDKGAAVTQQSSSNRKAKAGTPEYADIRRRIREAATDLMAEHGVSKFRFEALAERVGLNRATLYRYFDSKEELVREVMMALMHEMTGDIISKAASGTTVTRRRFTETLYQVIMDLRQQRRYAIVMDAQHVETFAALTHEYFSGITSTMLEKHLTGHPAGRTLKEGIGIPEAVHWLMHQIISYGFFGLPGETEKQQKAYLEKMVVSVIL
jgi:AcrR family transcriptional regulator